MAYIVRISEDITYRVDQEFIWDNAYAPGEFKRFWKDKYMGKLLDDRDQPEVRVEFESEADYLVFLLKL